MNPWEQLDTHRYLFLLDLREVDGDFLTLQLAEGVVLEPAVHPLGRAAKITSKPVEVTAASARYRVTFRDYVAFSVRNESYTNLDESEEFVGNNFRIFSKSRFLEYVAAATFASPAYPGGYTHYQLVCCDHIIDVASVEPPEVAREDAA